jgi:type II secretory pathway pseudopilin PulG
MGFTFVELMVAMGLTLLLLGTTLSLLTQLQNTADLVCTMSDVNENLRAGLNMVARDFSTAGTNIPQGGVPIPNGGAATAINRPGPGPSNFVGTFPAGAQDISAITPGPGLGPTQGSQPTDIVNILSVNPLSQLNQNALLSVTYTANGSAVINVDTTTCGWGNPASPCPPGFGPASSVVSPGQLILLQNANGSCLLTATDVNATTGVVTFTQNDSSDAMGLNQFPCAASAGSCATSGTIYGLVSGGLIVATTAYSVNLVTYYLDTSTPRRLMRIVGAGPNAPPRAVALGVNLLQFSYSTSPPGVPDPTNNPATPNQIRKVNLYIEAEGDHKNLGTGQLYSNYITTSVTVQNLAYYNRY